MTELVRQSKKGDKDSFGTLINNVKEKAYKLAYTYLRNEEDSMDAVCEGVLIAYKKLHTLKKDEFFETWFMRIVINECKKSLKSREKAVNLVKFIQEKEPAYLEDNNRELMILVKDRLKKMNEKDRKIIYLKFFLGYKFKDIADQMDMPLSSVKSRAYRGIDELKKVAN